MSMVRVDRAAARKELECYPVGTRVRVNDRFPSPLSCGLTGLIVAVPNTQDIGRGRVWITVRFDEGQDTPIKCDVTWHYSYFDVLERVAL